MKFDVLNSARLPRDSFVFEWAGRQTKLARAFQESGKGVSETENGRAKKNRVMLALDKAILDRANICFSSDWYKLTRSVFKEKLENPGTLETFIFFRVPESDEAIRFYADLWTGKINRAMLAFHEYGRNLQGTWRSAPASEAWAKMVLTDGFARDEVSKTEDVAGILKRFNGQDVCFFEGGYLPVRLYDACLKHARVVCFETHDFETRAVEKHPVDLAPRKLKVIRDTPLSAVKHLELRGSFFMVVAHGVAPRLDSRNLKELARMLENAAFLLRRGGFLSFDVLLKNQSLDRLLNAQQFPGADKLKVYLDNDSAVLDTEAALKLANDASWFGKLALTEVWTNNSEIWGDTSVRFTLRKV